MAEHNEIGKTGEKITETFLMKHGFAIHSRNFRTPYGEIDIIAEKDNILRFVEVKCVKVRNVGDARALHVKPEDNLTAEKWRKLVLSLQIYLKRRNVSSETAYQMDLACVYLDTETKQGRVVLMENIHKE
jgi:putative endonuclease